MNKKLFAAFFATVYVVMHADAPQNKFLSYEEAPKVIEDKFLKHFRTCLLENLTSRQCDSTLFKFATTDLDEKNCNAGREALERIHKRSCTKDNSLKKCFLIEEIYDRLNQTCKAQNIRS